MPKTVFVCGDTVQAAMLDDLTQRLRSEGIRVIRGPANDSSLKTYSPDECRRYLGEAEVGVFTIRHDVSRTLLDHAPNLRAICFPTIGVESVDVDAANERGVLIAHGATPGNVVGMSEATIMLMLTLLYSLHDSLQRMRNGAGKPAYPLAHCLHGKTVGLVGFGRIARAMTQRLVSFEPKILTYSPRSPRASLPPKVISVDLDTLLVHSDIVCVLVSINPESRALIGKRELSLMKPSAFLVNTARGEAIDELALYKSLERGDIAGAALDTFETEPLAADSPLRTLDNVLLTPHMVGQTAEARDEFIPAMFENITRMLDGKMPLYCKNPKISESWFRNTGSVRAETPDRTRRWNPLLD